MARMKKSVKARWVAALRSGEYKQGIGELRSADDRFCCLGVLCDLHGDRWRHDSHDEPYSYDQHSHFNLPPKTMVAAFGFDWGKVHVKIGKHVATLYDHNDAGRTFAEIADAIEAQL